jgi:hypothetical protein
MLLVSSGLGFRQYIFWSQKVLRVKTFGNLYTETCELADVQDLSVMRSLYAFGVWGSEGVAPRVLNLDTKLKVSG